MFVKPNDQTMHKQVDCIAIYQNQYIRSCFLSLFFLTPAEGIKRAPHNWEEEALKVGMIAPTQAEREAHKVKRVAYPQIEIARRPSGL